MDVTLPLLRQDLKIHRGTKDIWGAPGWIIEDPVKNQFYRIDQKAFEILARFSESKTVLDLIEKVNEQTVFKIDETQVQDFIQNLVGMDLIQVQSLKGIQSLQQKKQNKDQAIKAIQKIQKSLFMLFPLLWVDGFLEKTKQFVQPFFSKTFAIFLSALFLFDLYLIAGEWELFVHEFKSVFQLSSVPSILFSLVLIKLLHEFAHAYAAKIAGARVGAMGIALMFFYPVFYTDATSAWLVRDRKKRLLMNAAGMLSEWMVATIALFLWVSLDAGLAKQVCFYLGTVSLISSVLINANPFMKFDGYYVLSDGWGIENLQARGIAFAKWDIRKKILKWTDEPPEFFPDAVQQKLIWYGYGIWVYRIFLYTGLIVVFDYIFDPPLSFWLSVSTIIIFLVRPVFLEMKAWFDMKEKWMKIPSLVRISSMVLVALFFLCFPFFSAVQVGGIIQPSKTWTQYTVDASVLKKINVDVGQSVQAGDVLLVFESVDLEQEKLKTEEKYQALKSRADQSTVDPILSRGTQVLKGEASEVLETTRRLNQKIDNLTVTAPLDGTVVEIIENKYLDQWVSSDQKIVTIAENESEKIVTAFATMKDIQGIEKGDKAIFYPRSKGMKAKKVVVLNVEQTPQKTIPHEILIRQQGGIIDVERGKQEGAFLSVQPLYRIDAELLEEETQKTIEQWVHTEPGILVLDGKGQSIATMIINAIARVLRFGF